MPRAPVKKPRVTQVMGDDYFILSVDPNKKVKKPTRKEIDAMRQREMIRKDPLHTV